MLAPRRDGSPDRCKYDAASEALRAERERSVDGEIVLRGKDRPWIMGRQALVRRYMFPFQITGRRPRAALDEWTVFVQDIRVHSGKHRHQGGLVIYVLEGEGYSVVDGERHDWEAGDLLLLPLKPGGVEHQHFNRDPNRSAKWIAFISRPLLDWGATELVQIQHHPDFKDGQDKRPRAR